MCDDGGRGCQKLSKKFRDVIYGRPHTCVLNHYLVNTCQSTTVECKSDCHGIENCSKNCHQQNCSQVVEKKTVWHAVTGLKDDWRKHEQEEYVGRESRGWGLTLIAKEYDEPDNDSQNGEEARLWNSLR